MGKRIKYDYAFRLKCVETVLKEHRSVNSVAGEYGFSRSNLHLWLDFYDAYGLAGLKDMGRRRYDTDFKLKVLSTIDEEGLSLKAACVRFIIPSYSIIVKWKQAYKLKGSSGLTNKTRGRPPKENMPSIKRKPRSSAQPLSREEELLKENQYLRAENELLKKLQALAQANKKQKP